LESKKARLNNRQALLKDYASLFTSLRSSKAFMERALIESSAPRNQVRGSYFFLLGSSGPSGLPICPC